MICTGRFFDFVIELLRIHNDETTWEFFLHKVYDKSYADFKEAVESDGKVVSETDAAAIAEDSFSIIGSFCPESQEVRHGDI